MLIVFVSIAVLGVTAFIIQRLLENTSNQTNTQCIYLAQAGIHDAIYWYRFRDSPPGNGYFSLGQTNIDANNFFVLGGTASDLLMVDTSGSSIGPLTGPPGQRYRQLLGLNIQNATNSKAITIDRMLVTWDNSKKLRTIRIHGSDVWTGNDSSPYNADIEDFTLDTVLPACSIDYLEFNGDMSDVTIISIEFRMTDGTSKTLTVYSVPVPPQNYSFTVKATGKTTGSGIYRTIQADYNALTGKITNYYEINTEITP